MMVLVENEVQDWVFFLDKTNLVEQQSSFRKDNIQGRWSNQKVTFNTLLSEQGFLYVFFN